MAEKEKNLEEKTEDMFLENTATAGLAIGAGIASIPFIEYIGASMGAGFGLGQLASNWKTGRKNTVKDISYSTLVGTGMGAFVYAMLNPIGDYLSTSLLGVPFSSVGALGKFAYMYAGMLPFMATQYSLEYVLKEQGPLNFLKNILIHPIKTTKEFYNHVSTRVEETLPAVTIGTGYFAGVVAFADNIAKYAKTLGAAISPTNLIGALFGLGDAVYGFLTATPNKEKEQPVPAH
jgi:hypothetical protein